MKDISMADMMQMQQALWEKNRDQWAPMDPAYAREFLLWMIDEMGEAIAIIKKKGDQAIMNEPVVREAFVEEMSDVLMYYVDALMRYKVSPEELADSYRRKHLRNLTRAFRQENELFLNGDRAQP